MASQKNMPSAVSTIVCFRNKYDIKLICRLIFHGLGVLHHANVGITALTLDFAHYSSPELLDLKNHAPRYLTGWNVAFQSVFLVMAVGYDIAELAGNGNTKSALWLRHWADIVFTSLVFPYTIFVAFTFWSLYAVDRQLVYPESYDLVLPWDFNISIHGWIVVVLVLEMLLQPKLKPREYKIELIFLWIVLVAYTLLYDATYLQNGRWLYKVHQHMSVYQLCIFQVTTLFFMHWVYHAQFRLTQFVQGIHDTEHRENIKNDIWMNKNVINEAVTVNEGNDENNGVTANPVNDSVTASKLKNH